MKNLVCSMVCSSLAAVAVLLTSAVSSAHSRHTADICSATNLSVCLHIGYNDEFSTEVAGKFMVHFMVKPSATDVLNVKLIELWMPSMGHGSSPVTVTQKSPVHFKVSDANFIMAGDWVVRVKFEWKGSDHTIEVPFQIKGAKPAP